MASVVANWLEFFDFTVYAIFAVYIGRAFFPTFSPSGQILLSVMTFGLGFVFRPLGGIFIGAYGDRAGRRAAITLTILLMAVGTMLLGVTPGYDTVGPIAPWLVVLSRVIQGLSAGGTVGAATSYLVETAPDGRRGFYGCWQYASQGFGGVCAGIMGYILITSLTPEQMQVWGWRVPFIFGLLIAPIGFYIRSHMNETAVSTMERKTTGGILRDLTHRHGKLILTCVLAMMGSTISNYIITKYMTTYVIHTLHLPGDVGMLVTLIAGAAAVVGAVIGGVLSDKFGRRPLMIVPQVVFTLLAYPSFLVIAAQRSAPMLLSLIAGLSFLQAISGAVMILVMPECFPRAVRSAGTAVVYSLCVTIFGGTAQFIVTELLDVTGNAMAIAWYLVSTNIVGLVALALLKPPKASAHLA